jgi:hypothetical protein
MRGDRLNHCKYFAFQTLTVSLYRQAAPKRVPILGGGRAIFLKTHEFHVYDETSYLVILFLRMFFKQTKKLTG